METQLAAEQFEFYLDEEAAGYIIMGDQQPSESEENISYAPWTSEGQVGTCPLVGDISIVTK